MVELQVLAHDPVRLGAVVEGELEGLLYPNVGRRGRRRRRGRGRLWRTDGDEVVFLLNPDSRFCPHARPRQVIFHDEVAWEFPWLALGELVAVSQRVVHIHQFRVVTHGVPSIVVRVVPRGGLIAVFLEHLTVDSPLRYIEEESIKRQGKRRPEMKWSGQ